MESFVRRAIFLAGPKYRYANALVRCSSAHAVQRVIVFHVSANGTSVDRGSVFPRRYVIVVIIISCGRARRVADFFRHYGRSYVRFEHANFLGADSAGGYVFTANDFVMFEGEGVRGDGDQRELSTILRFVDHALLAVPVCLIRYGPYVPLRVFREEVEIEVRTV